MYLTLYFLQVVDPLQHPSANSFLNFLFKMRIFLFQDVAAMMVISEACLASNPHDLWAKERLEHYLFQHE